MSLELSPPFDNPIAEAVWRACITELQALKPGNVSVYSEGHGMGVDDFIRSARCVASVLGRPGLSVGERIFKSVQSTQAEVGCNTNLGIVLLCAPLAHGALEAAAGEALRERLLAVLKRLDHNDTEQVFRAIRLAQPAGLGRSQRHDVGQPAAAGLLAVMREAERRDRIAYQYAHGFADVFDIGLPTLQEELARWRSATWAAVGVYLRFLAGFPDTHIQRKLGEQTAEEVRRESERLLGLFRASEQPKQITQPLQAFDDSLKKRGINPGTSADLTVATLLARRLQTLNKCDFLPLDSHRGNKSLPESGHPREAGFARVRLT